MQVYKHIHSMHIHRILAKTHVKSLKDLLTKTKEVASILNEKQQRNVTINCFGLHLIDVVYNLVYKTNLHYFTINL